MQFAARHLSGHFRVREGVTSGGGRRKEYGGEVMGHIPALAVSEHF